MTGHYGYVVRNAYATATNAAFAISIVSGVLAIELHPGIVIDGSVGRVYTIQVSDDAGSEGSWLSVTNLALEQPRQVWIDPMATTGKSRRLYRALVSPCPRQTGPASHAGVPSRE